MTMQDLGYKRLLAHREMVADLLTGFVREPCIGEVELDTLERAPESYVTDDLRKREDDSTLLAQERGYAQEELAPMRNLVAARFRLENSRSPDDVLRVVGSLVEWLETPEPADLCHALVA